MPVGFKSGTNDLETVFLTKAEFTPAAVNALVNSLTAVAHQINADTLSGVSSASILCSGCDWTCTTLCTGMN